MRRIETSATVMDDGTVTLQLPPDIAPGEHQIIMMIDEQPVVPGQRPPLHFSAYPVGLVSDAMTFRREDVYDGNDYA